MILNFKNFNRLNENVGNELNPNIKEWLIDELSSWARTWEGEDEEVLMGEEPKASGFDNVMALVDKLENNQLDEHDYREIVFHLYQMNYDDIEEGLPISEQDSSDISSFEDFKNIVTAVYDYYI